MRILLLAPMLLLTIAAKAQHSLKGRVMDTSAYAIPFTTVALLQPADSTLEFFGITNADGDFEIKGIAAGKYLMQVAFMGFKTYYKPVDIPYKDGNFGNVVLLALSKQLEEVQISGERVPVMIKGDTVEYNAGAFKTRPDAAVADLLKKMPGIQVDHNGNIKAQGEGVNKVLVDGKEFFGSDPKVATQNLPADAINKVQVFNNKSEAAQFTGIDDGSREKTINLMLKDGKKAGYFGDVQAGVGTNERYKLNGKLYKFRQKSQFAAIGMVNNINQAGFSFQDYINFNGGLQSFMSGGQSQFSFGGDIPVDFGQQVTGLIHSGAAGLNYSYEPRKNDRIALSYLANGADKTLEQQVRTENFTTDEPFIRTDDSREHTQNLAHRLNINARKDVDSVNRFTLAGSASLADSRGNGNSLSVSTVRDVVLNKLDRRTEDKGNSIRANGNAAYIRSTEGKWPVLQAGVDASFDKTLNRTEWNNITNILTVPTIMNDKQFQRDEAVNGNYTANASAMRHLGKSYYLEPELKAGINTQAINRRQGVPGAEQGTIDSLSPDFTRIYQWLRPGLSLRKSAGKNNLNMSLRAEAATLTSMLNDATTQSGSYAYVLPSVNWQYEFNSSKRLSLGYTTAVTAPAASRMLPVLNNANPLQQYRGNDKLVPEYRHTANASWLHFDQFNMTSLVANASASYIANNISWARTINNDLTQSITPINVAYGVDANGRVEYGRPIRSLKINFNASLNERYEQSISKVNKVDNIANTFTHEFTLTVDNRKKDKLDVSVGGTVSLSNATYSVDQSLNNTFYNLTGFADVNYTPSASWNFMAGADVTQYNARSFDQAVLVPILKAEVAYCFLKSKRGTLSLYGFDLLDRNKGIERISELNYLRQITSNVIGRYVMLSFKYRLGKMTNNPLGKMDIKIRR